MSEVNSSLNSKTGGLTYSVLVVLYILIIFVLSAIVAVAKIDQHSDVYVYISYLASPVVIACSYIFANRIKKVTLRQVFPVKCHFKYYVIALLLIFGLLFFLGNVNTYSVEFFKLFGYKPRESETYFPDMSGGLVVPALLVMAVIPALFEELMFRGILLNCCENGAGSIRTVFITGFCFSLYHTSPEQTVYQFLAGCAFAFLAVRAGSILPSVVMHFINNALIVIFNACSLLDETGNVAMSGTVSIILTVLAGISLAGAIVWLVLDRKKPLKKCEKGGVKDFFIYASPAIAILGIMWICSLFGVA